MTRLSEADKAGAPTTAQEAAEVGYELRLHGRGIVAQLDKLGPLKAQAQYVLDREEATAGIAEQFEPRKSNEDQRRWITGRAELSRWAQARVIRLLRACETVGLEGIEDEEFTTVADLRFLVDLLKAAMHTADKAMRAHESDSTHQVTVTSWARREFEQTMDGRLD